MPAPGSNGETVVSVAVDTNGADLGPEEVAAGAAIAARQGVRALLFGPAARLGRIDTVGGLVEVIDAPVSIAKVPDPVAAARSTRDASIVLAARAVAEGRADALVSGGSTGAALAAGLLNVKRAQGIYRPALALPLPVPGRQPVTLLDVGANTEVRPEHLVQFAFMGAALASAVLGIRRPRVALLSNGEEGTKGTPLVQEAHALLLQRAAASPLVDFVGNIEGTTVLSGDADVIVADGFTGNVTLKLIEGVSQATLQAVRAAATASSRARLGGLLLRPALRGLRDDIDPETPGGAYLLGLRKLGVVPHGRFTRVGFSQAILLAARGVTNDVVGRTHAALEEAGALKRSPLASDPAATVPGTS
ncbi:phosphate acyltransferase PlsX [Baekduia soli]|uniref:Phosphate acyltransferase n=1 Tax=Baekduia soli TaxID=496014 RepID=A0A5B8U744_9ACTN|nr:phosphate acyltransferase PlsX [Baekduia soli]QEC48668.1 phosphate acyltransferase PlsX [Baekduia soli]